MKKWTELPTNMQNDEVRKYYDILQKHRISLLIKRVFDLVVASVMLVVISPILLFLSILIKLDSKGPVLFRQVRVTRYGRTFRIFKFRTMVNHAERMGTQVTTKGDMRITRLGRILRKYRLDELPQLLNIIRGEMSFVGTRPEVEKYVAAYTDEMMATLLLPAGVTSQASIQYKDEEKLLANAEDADQIYIDQILPAKMKYNLEAIEQFSFGQELKTMFETVLAVIR